MDGSYIALSFWQVSLAALLILAIAMISLLLRLGLGWNLLLAGTRMAAQLILVGLLLHWVFAWNRWEAVLLLMLSMTFIAGLAAVERTDRRYPGIWWNSILSVWANSWAIAWLAIFFIVQVEPWYRPQYAIPLLGMILGNSLNGISLGLDRFGREVETQRDRIETLLAIGATRWEAARPSVREAIRTGMIPTLNAMTVAGIVSLPGMMTGQLLAGVAPLEAAKYQIVIFFLIAAGTALGTIGVVLLSYRCVFNSHHQFLQSAFRSRHRPSLQ